MRQIRMEIGVRSLEKFRAEMTTREAELRTMCSYIAGASSWKDGVASAARIKLMADAPSAENLPSTADVEAMFRAR